MHIEFTISSEDAVKSDSSFASAGFGNLRLQLTSPKVLKNLS